jgi:hypothetical protein
VLFVFVIKLTGRDWLSFRSVCALDANRECRIEAASRRLAPATAMRRQSSGNLAAYLFFNPNWRLKLGGKNPARQTALVF